MKVQSQLVKDTAGFPNGSRHLLRIPLPLGLTYFVIKKALQTNCRAFDVSSKKKLKRLSNK